MNYSIASNGGTVYVSYGKQLVKLTDRTTEEVVKEIEQKGIEKFLSDLSSRPIVPDDYDKINKLKSYGIEFKDNAFYWGSELTLPEALVDAIYNEPDNVNKYKNFWAWCHLMTKPSVRANLFKFCKNYGIEITDEGLLILYRKVVCTDPDYSEMIKSLLTISDTFEINKDITLTLNGKELSRHTLLFNPESLSHIPFTHAQNASKRLYYFPGQFAEIPRSECDESDATCSKGLHGAGKSWLTDNQFGEIPIVIIVNPADIVSVPPESTYGKLRMCKFYFSHFALLNENNTLSEKQLHDYNETKLNSLNHVYEASKGGLCELFANPTEDFAPNKSYNADLMEICTSFRNYAELADIEPIIEEDELEEWEPAYDDYEEGGLYGWGYDDEDDDDDY